MSRRVIPAILALLACAAAVAGTKSLTFEELMRFRQIDATVLSDDGRVVAYAVSPDRGDGEAIVRTTDGRSEWRVERGAAPVVAVNGSTVALAVTPPLVELLRHERDSKGKGDGEGDDDDGPRSGLAIVRTAADEVLELGEAKSFALSRDGRFVAWIAYPDEPADDSEESEEPGESETSAEPEEADDDAPVCPGDECEREVGTTLTLLDLRDGGRATFEHVRHAAFDHDSRVLAFSRGTPDGAGNGVFAVSLAAPSDARPVAGADGARVTALAWPETTGRLAVVTAPEDDDGTLGVATVWTWRPGDDAARGVVAAEALPDGTTVPEKAPLVWTRDGERLWVRLGPAPEKDADDEESDGDEHEEALDPYDRQAILEDVTLDVWHWDDPLIKTNERVFKDKDENLWTTAVLHADGTFAVLSDESLEDVAVVQNATAIVGYAPGPYMKLRTWEGFFRDAYRIDLRDGSRSLIARRLASPVSLSPSGRFAAYYDDRHWHLFDARSGATRTLTADLDASFVNEDHDYPFPVPGYGVADWIEDRAVLIYDKFDVWRFPVDGSAPARLTEGREADTIFRVVDTDPDRDFVRPGEPLLLRGYHERRKSYSFHAARAGTAGTRELVAAEARFDFVARAKDADTLLYTRQRYDEFPDLWATDLSFETTRRLSDVNPQLADYAWGSAELVEWLSADGVPLQGVLIKPGNYEPGKRYPVLVYFYRLFSQRLHEFNEPVVNHRPSFPMYASNGYAVFLPDVRFDVGLPGRSAVKCLVPGVTKLVEMGVADPEAIGLHGHSWSGYQAAYVVTETDVFAAAVPGAPVSNMTSAYSGIRLETGLARQFQYEQFQSRIGASLWEARDLYIENSPVFFADRIDTPLLIQFGDRDEAVPWQQGVELILALRRLQKPAVMLQYRGEPHHLKQYPNKLDYSIKMMEFFDHFLKGEPAPAWWTEGVAYEPE